MNSAMVTIVKYTNVEAMEVLAIIIPRIEKITEKLMLRRQAIMNFPRSSNEVISGIFGVNKLMGAKLIIYAIHCNLSRSTFIRAKPKVTVIALPEISSTVPDCFVATSFTFEPTTILSR